MEISVERLNSLSAQIIEYFNVSEDEVNPRLHPNKVSFIKRIAKHWTSEGIMVTEEIMGDLEFILQYFDKGQSIPEDDARNILVELRRAHSIVIKYQNIMKHFNVDDFLVRKFVNNVNTIENDLDEVNSRLSKIRD
ncbi:MAG TPA: hypothetical protein ACFCUD_14570 [Cyclobacteriaceae bacterium]